MSKSFTFKLTTTSFTSYIAIRSTIRSTSFNTHPSIKTISRSINISTTI